MGAPARALASLGPVTLDEALTAGIWRPLPATAAELLTDLEAPARLGAHLRLVHDVAWSLTDALGRRRPALDFDTTAVLFGAATHDVGKVEFPAELSGPGRRHEFAGRRLLLRYGVPSHLARFAASHGSWTDPELGLDDLLVSLADQLGKGRRDQALEELVRTWTGHAGLDDVVTRLAAGADERVAFERSF
jgi:hypothetical protein